MHEKKGNILSTLNFKSWNLIETLLCFDLQKFNISFHIPNVDQFIKK